MSRRPITLHDAEVRGLLRADGAGIYTFSNGTEWEIWAEGNCFECMYWDYDGPAGKYCAFEAASMLHIATPELAEMFGWLQNPKYANYRAPHDKGERCCGWASPDQCACFKQRERDDDGNDLPPPPPPDPLQLVLIADPTEDAAALIDAPVEAFAGSPL